MIYYIAISGAIFFALVITLIFSYLCDLSATPALLRATCTGFGVFTFGFFLVPFISLQAVVVLISVFGLSVLAVKGVRSISLRCPTQPKRQRRLGFVLELDPPAMGEYRVSKYLWGES